MTLEPYSPERLDGLALRLLDVAGALRGLAEKCRAEGLIELELHDKKALEWIARLEQWTEKTGGDLQVRIVKHRASQRARRTGRPAR